MCHFQLQFIVSCSFKVSVNGLILVINVLHLNYYVYKWTQKSYVYYALKHDFKVYRHTTIFNCHFTERNIFVTSCLLQRRGDNINDWTEIGLIA